MKKTKIINKMKKTKFRVLCGVMSIVGIAMISIAVLLSNDATLDGKAARMVFKEFDMKSIAASTNMIIEDTTSKKEDIAFTLKEVSMEVIPASIIIPPRIEVYDGLTIEELAAKFDKLLGNGYMAGKGNLIASTALEYEVDPYIALAIILHETGCVSNCSRLVVTCNNVGGQKGSPGCNGGSYKAFNSLDEGILGFVKNLYKNYFAMGLTTVEQIGPKYAESSEWVPMINYYVNRIRNT